MFVSFGNFPIFQKSLRLLKIRPLRNNYKCNYPQTTTAEWERIYCVKFCVENFSSYSTLSTRMYITRLFVF